MSERRLIDANALKTRINNVPMHGDTEVFYDIMSELVAVVAAAPTIDAVEIVRCRECKNSSRIASEKEDGLRHCWSGRGTNKGDGMSRVRSDGYCDDGKRKGERNG